MSICRAVVAFRSIASPKRQVRRLSAARRSCSARATPARRVRNRQVGIRTARVGRGQLSGDRRARGRRAHARPTSSRVGRSSICSAPGVAFMWLRGSLRTRLFPTQTGWFADEDIFAMSIAIYSPHASACRFEAARHLSRLSIRRRGDGADRGGRRPAIESTGSSTGSCRGSTSWANLATARASASTAR